ncbi:unnamed protein product [Brachionus calyciflorus]|uniref:Uncharacterized protein n=1 Tax=Brachionus calyciflorus TaxID=104777 RepID=A0A814PK13_9BILA|nr:unnamed protein product [Brachionus calyciflorus]
MAQVGDTFKFSIKKFDGTDFVLWKDKVFSASRATQCSEAIKEDFESDSPEKSLKNEKAKKRILNTRQEENESVEEFIDRVQNFREEIEALGQKMTDQDIAMTIMQGLIPEYENFVQCLTLNAYMTSGYLTDVNGRV